MLERTPDSPLRGPYLVHNPAGYAALRCADVALGALAPRRGDDAALQTPPRRLLLSNIAHLGDVVLATALLPLVRAAYPEVELGMLVSRGAVPVVEGHPALSWVHTYDHWKADRSGRPLRARLRAHSRSFAAALRDVREPRYDVAVDLNFHYPNAIPLLWLAEIPVRVGFPTGGRGALLTHPVPWHPGVGHVTAYGAALLAELPGFGVAATDLRPDLPDGPAPPVEPPYTVIHPGAGTHTKEWPEARWQALVAALAGEGRALVFTGAGQSEARLNAALAAAVPGAVDLTGRLAWSGFVATLRGAQAVITVDTAAGHVASAFGVPAVVLMNGVHPPALWRPLGDRNEVLTHPVPCAPCHLGRGCEGMECIRDLPLAPVRDALRRVEAP